ncbi:phage major capsid protein [Marimonas lutisalis]|uniref:phage major capsid protein n=1 Tax=Marimonas lutisalis TaxID=2545756 RepID=UPI0010F9800B|nr:phage major capsid protein [Marimonas lutisalis]
MKIEQIQKQHTAKLTEARAVCRKIKPGLPEKEARALEDQFDKLMDEADELRDQLLDAQSADPRRPFGGDVTQRGVADAGEERHTKAFTSWLRAPQDQHTRQALLNAESETRAASGLTGAAGGFVVPEIIQTPILARARDENPFRSLVRVVNVESGDVKFPLSESDATNGWVGETGTRTATTEPTLASKTPTFGTSYAYVSASEELVADGLIDIAQWFTEEAGRALGDAEMTAIISGNGTDKPTGLLNTAPESGADGSRTADAFKYIASGAANDLGSTIGDLLTDTYYDLKASYRARGTWCMNSATASVIRQVKDQNDRPLWGDSLAEGQPAMLLGHPVVIAEGMPDIGTDEHPIAFGDWSRAYILAMRGGLRATVDDNISTPGLVKFYIRERLGGCVYDENALRFIKCAAS